MTIKRNNERPMILGGPEFKRRLALRRIGALAGLTAFGGTSALLSGCGGGGGGTSTPPAAPPQVINPSPGAHNLEYVSAVANALQVITPLSPPSSSGSTILVCVGRGDIDEHVPPTDNIPNTYALLDGPNNYDPEWRFSGTALYSSSASAGVNAITVSNGPTHGEVTVAVVEILNGAVIENLSWIYAPFGPTQTSDPVATTGPATLVAFWWGAANVRPQDAVPEAGFTRIDAVLDDVSGQWVQCAVAVKNVSAGTHTVTWTSDPPQRAQLYLVAVQNA